MDASIIPGLPPYGSPAIPIPEAWGESAREGVVVRFTVPGLSPWTGNFKPGISGATALVRHPNSTDFVVLANGAGYVVTPESREYVVLGAAINRYWQLEAPERLLFDHEGLSLQLLDRTGIRWRTRRFSWDGLAEVVVSRERVTGLAYSPTAEDDEWLPFEVDLKTGVVHGGAVPSLD
jgi:hypothetical protein